MADKDNKMEKSIKEAIGKSLNEFNKKIGMAKIIKDNKNQDRILKGILSQVNDENTEKTEKSNVITLDNSTDGIVELKEIKGDTNVNVSKMEKETPITHVIDDKYGNVISLDGITEGAINIDDIEGNTMVNCCKDGSKELTLNGDIDTSGYNNVTLTEGVDGGKVDIALEGNTMVNVCDQEDPIAITKNYEITTGNHVALQGEYDGKCRPNIYGNTLVNLWDVKSAEISGQVVKTDTAVKIKTTDNIYSNFFMRDKKMFKPSTEYTFIINVIKNTLADDSTIRITSIADGTNRDIFNNSYSIQGGKTGIFIVKLTTIADFSQANFGVRSFFNNPSKTSNCEAELNIVILEGDYTNKPIPDYFTGMKSSFEDKLVPENLITETYKGWSKNTNANGNIYNIYKKYTSNKEIKPNTVYTVIISKMSKYCDGQGLFQYISSDGTSKIISKQFINNKCFTINLTDITEPITSGITLYQKFNDITGNEVPIDGGFYIVEGDYTNYDFTDYDSTKGSKYRVDYKVTGKNKCPRCTTTSTFCNGITFTYDATTQTFSYSGTATNISTFLSIPCPNLKLLKDKSYIFSVDNPLTDFSLQATELGVGYNCNLPPGQSATPIVNLDKFTSNAIMLYSQNLTIGQSYSGTFKVQIEEGTKTTTYESYKEYTKTLYLNTPLLEGDTIEQSGNDIVHVHKYNSVTFDGSDDEGWTTYFKELDGSTCIWTRMPKEMKIHGQQYSTLICDKLCYIAGGFINNSTNISTYVTNDHNNNGIYVRIMNTQLNSSDVQGAIQWLQANPITVAYELATPTQEIISTNDNLLLDSYVNGHLDVDSIVPIDKVVFQSYGTGLKYLSPNTEYTIQFESDNNGKLDALALNSSDVIGNLNIVKGINKFNITTSDKITINYLWTTGIGFNMSKVVVTPKVDGDFGYFKGMKSVGQDDVDGHKIEILLQNKNLYVDCFEFGDIQKLTGLNSPSQSIYRTRDYIKVEPNTNYFFSRKFTSKWHSLYFYDINKNYTGYNDTFGNKFVTPNNVYYVRYKFAFTDSSGDYIMQIEKGNKITDYIEGKQNKKEILMNEPLRGLPNGVRDKYVIIDGKWYIERNCGYVTFDGSDDEGWSDNGNIENTYFKYIYNSKTDAKKKVLTSICDKLPTISTSRLQTSIIENTSTGKIQIGCTLSTTAQFIQWLQQNPITVVYELATPIYKPIDYNPFEVYSDITHISNNSLIPANMVIKNSGYNCILKPSTLYTIALDTNKNGTIGMNLGGGKGTTSNNVATITTPATLIDNTLRLYGKGIKASGIRLLEGDKTNWIPSHFEGMKSCFEDRLQDDGKYKMEILSRNSDESLSNKIQFLLNEPLRAVGNVKDKVYVKEDKIVVQRNCKQIAIQNSDIDKLVFATNLGSDKYLVFYLDMLLGRSKNDRYSIKSNKFTTRWFLDGNSKAICEGVFGEQIIQHSDRLYVSIDKKRLISVDKQGVIKWLVDNKVCVTYTLEEPIYEEIEYSNNRLTLDSYNNSTLFYDSNIPVSNTSFKPLWEELVYVKNSTTYYIQFNAVGSGNIVVNLGGTELSTTITEGYNKIEITTPNESTNLLTIDGQGIKISKVVVSEALCSGYYKGLQSCFEEHMENGKYVCVIRGISLDGNKVNGIKFHLNEPLRGIGDIKDRLCIKDNKLIVERNCSSVTFDGSDDEYWNATGYGGHATRNTFEINFDNLNSYKGIVPCVSNLFINELINTIPVNDNAFRAFKNAQNYTYFLFTPSTNIIPYRDTTKWKEFLQQNPVTIVYQLATPVYEEITNEYGLPIILEGYENGIVYVDSAVTPTTSIKYTSNNTVPTTLSNVDNLNATTQDDINDNIVTYMMDIDMMLTEMEMEDNASIMSLSDSDDNNQKHNRSNNNILDRMNKEDRIKYQDNTTKMLEKVIKGKSLTNEENINRIDLYLSEGKIREEQSNYLRELLKGDE